MGIMRITQDFLTSETWHVLSDHTCKIKLHCKLLKEGTSLKIYHRSFSMFNAIFFLKKNPVILSLFFNLQERLKIFQQLWLQRIVYMAIVTNLRTFISREAKGLVSLLSCKDPGSEFI